MALHNDIFQNYKSYNGMNLINPYFYGKIYSVHALYLILSKHPFVSRPINCNG